MTKGYLNVGLPNINEEGLDTLVVLGLVQKNELHIFRVVLGERISATTIAGSTDLDGREAYSLPGVMKADTVHSLNLSTDFKYLFLTFSRQRPLAADVITDGHTWIRLASSALR